MDKMTPESVRARVQQIADLAGDFERAHSEEDKLRREVLHAIAHGLCEDPVACAAEALQTEDLDFARYCA